IHEFKDKQGRIVLKRSNVADGSTTGRNTDPDPGMEMMLTVDTYYVYDIYGNLAFVIPPLAAGQADPNEVLDELCYQYKYDDRNRLVEKKLPGKGWEFMVYDKQDRLVATQDANLRNDGGKWIFTKYDKFGRVVYTGITTGSRSTVQSAVNNAGSNNETRTPSAGFTKNGLAVYYSSTAFPTSFSELLSVNYYDSFQNINMNGAPAPSNTSVLKGLPVAASIRIIGSASWEHIYTYYDEKARPFKSYKKNHLGGFTQTESELDFRGKPLQTLTLHKRNPSGIEVKTTDYFVYDKMERLIRHSQSIGNATTRNLIAQNQYDRLGQLVAKKVGGTQLNG